MTVTGLAGVETVWCFDIVARGGASFKFRSGSDKLGIDGLGGVTSLVIDMGGR